MKCTGLKRMLTCLLAAAMVVSYCPMALAEDGNSGAEGNSGGATPSTTTPSAVETQQPEETEQPQLFNLNSGAGKSLQTGTEDTVQAYAWIPFYAETTHTLANAKEFFVSFDYYVPSGVDLGTSFTVWSSWKDLTNSQTKKQGPTIVQTGDKLTANYGSSSMTVTSNLSRDVWHHFVLHYTRSGSNGVIFNVYLDGTPAETGTMNYSINTNNSETFQLPGFGPFGDERDVYKRQASHRYKSPSCHPGNEG